MVCLCICSVSHNHYLWISVDCSFSLLPLVLMVYKRHFPRHLLASHLYLCLDSTPVSSCSKYGRLWSTFSLSRTAQPGEGVGEGLQPKNGGLRTRIWAGRWEEKEARCFKEEMKKGWNQSRGRGREDWMNVKRGVGRVGTGSVGSLLFHKPTCTTQFEDNAGGLLCLH